MDSGLTSVTDYTGNDWKLTLRDDSHSSLTANANSAVCTSTKVISVEIKYSNAKAGDNEHISAMFQGSDGTVKAYGRIKALASGEESGTVTISLSDFAPDSGDKLYVFNEQYNGDEATDYAGPLREVVIPTSVNAYDITNTLTDITTNNTATYRRIGETGDYTAALTAAQGYVLPQSIEVKVGGTALTEGDSTYTYDVTTGEVKIFSSAITGDIELIAKGALPQEKEPTASFTATSHEGGTLSNVDMIYNKKGQGSDFK